MSSSNTEGSHTESKAVAKVEEKAKEKNQNQIQNKEEEKNTEKISADKFDAADSQSSSQ